MTRRQFALTVAFLAIAGGAAVVLAVVSVAWSLGTPPPAVLVPVLLVVVLLLSALGTVLALDTADHRRQRRRRA